MVRYSKKSQKFSIREIVVPKRLDDVDSDVVADIANSIKLTGLINVPIVRIVETAEAREVRLVAGATRVAALRQAGEKDVWCRVVKATAREARLISLSEDIWRRRLSVLTHAEKVMEYIESAIALRGISGQVVRKSGLGRPPSGMAEVARAFFPIIGFSTPEARRKSLSRVKKIAEIKPEAKAKARELGLDDNQAALLSIWAAGDTATAQVKKVGALAAGSDQSVKLHNRTSTAPGNDKNPESSATKRSSKSKDNTITGGETTAQQVQTDYMALEQAWIDACSALWDYTAPTDRARFIDMLSRTRFKLSQNAWEFVKDIFQGRKEIAARQFYSFGTSCGFTKKELRQIVKSQGHKSSRYGDKKGPVFFINADPDGLASLPRIYSDAQVQVTAPTVEVAEDPFGGVRDPYFDEEKSDLESNRSRGLREIGSL
jgi:ParB-like chromosome segregation protein Spo0J